MFLKNIFIVHSLRFAQILSICSSKIFSCRNPASKSISDRCRHLRDIAASRAVSGIAGRKRPDDMPLFFKFEEVAGK